MSNKLINYLETAGLNWAVPVVRLCRGEDAREQASELFTKVGLPLIAVLVFLLVWSVGASQVKTSLGVLGQSGRAGGQSGCAGGQSGRAGGQSERA